MYHAETLSENEICDGLSICGLCLSAAWIFFLFQASEARSSHEQRPLTHLSIRSFVRSFIHSFIEKSSQSLIFS